MKIKSILRHLTKIPLLCLITVTVFLSDGIYDGILPWPSPFHISLSYVGNSFHFSAGWNSGCPAKGIENKPDADTPADHDSSLEAAGGKELISDHDADGEMSSNQADADIETVSNQVDTDSETVSDQAGADGEMISEHIDGNGDPQQTGADSSSPNEPDDNQIMLGDDGLPLVSYMQVENDYFDDAVFIGDSRTRSLQLYADLENTTFLADTGLTIYTVLDKKLTPSTSNTKTTVTDYLTQHQFRKVYLMLGINELGTGTAESFCRSYSEVLDRLRELQPDAIIYLQAILHISESKDREHTYINNAAIIERNEALASLADNEHIFWLDSNPAICDENGYLIDSYTFDGVHLQAKYVYLWMDYLRQHAVKTETPPYQPLFEPQPRAVQ